MFLLIAIGALSKKITFQNDQYFYSHEQPFELNMTLNTVRLMFIVMFSVELGLLVTSQLLMLKYSGRNTLLTLISYMLDRIAFFIITPIPHTRFLNMTATRLKQVAVVLQSCSVISVFKSCFQHNSFKMFNCR